MHDVAYKIIEFSNSYNGGAGCPPAIALATVGPSTLLSELNFKID